MSFTEADFNAWRFNRDVVHFNGGKEFFGWGHRCVDQPRLLVIDKCIRKDRSTQRSYLVDGKTPCTSLAEALAALDVAPVLTDEELRLLGTVQEEWVRPDERVPLLPLAEMGMIEWGRNAENRVTCRLTPAGAAMLGGATS
ncbi:hypothetical protein JQ633_12445 [Bradyrhizobium tropiciagri]|uniref:hypothetical protein n=1 Tax=Bradyrhizobium tropiciagri TaxID=312253 RepID=UPI001BA73CF3|nr:hypothetical protein [Bradyrhizobium tropiciagri]MBR0871172.1 hypothetical protein [Bradyrhizobium tropiciagri]